MGEGKQENRGRATAKLRERQRRHGGNSNGKTAGTATAKRRNGDGRVIGGLGALIGTVKARGPQRSSRYARSHIPLGVAGRPRRFNWNPSAPAHPGPFTAPRAAGPSPSRSTFGPAQHRRRLRMETGPQMAKPSPHRLGLRHRSCRCPPPPPRHRRRAERKVVPAHQGSEAVKAVGGRITEVAAVAVPQCCCCSSRSVSLLQFRRVAVAVPAVS